MVLTNQMESKINSKDLLKSKTETSSKKSLKSMNEEEILFVFFQHEEAMFMKSISNISVRFKNTFTKYFMEMK